MLYLRNFLEIGVKINKEMTEMTLKSRIFAYCALWGQVCSNQSCKNYKAVEHWNDLFSMHYSKIINWVRCQRHCQCLRHSIIHKLSDFLGLQWPPTASEVKSEVIRLTKSGLYCIFKVSTNLVLHHGWRCWRIHFAYWSQYSQMVFPWFSLVLCSSHLRKANPYCSWLLKHKM